MSKIMDNEVSTIVFFADREEIYSRANVSELFDKVEELKKQIDKGYALTYDFHWDYFQQVYRLKYRLHLFL